MTAEIFDGVAMAARLEEDLRNKISVWQSERAAIGASTSLTIAAIAFTQDVGSRIYSDVKAEAAARLGIEYDIHEFRFETPLPEVVVKIQQLNADAGVTGIIVQKPRRVSYEDYISDHSPSFNNWWRTLIEAVDAAKDVDGLTGKGRVVPATCGAVLTIMDLHQFAYPDKALIVGRSDLLGIPLHKKLLELGWGEEEVKLVGRAGLEALRARPEKLKDFTLIVSATGVPKLITGDEVGENSFLIDVGEPQGDFDFESCQKVARFITPVPGGVGPLTVIHLMKNCLELAS
jgi:methylenetetrahydrofolate dehydrogenase (NADP+)/methenyltetrahydrofolate cyclohydrolase